MLNYISVLFYISVLIEGAYSIFVYFDDHFCLHQSCFFFQMLEKFAEDDRIEQMNAQKRRMKQLEHKRAVEKLIEERRIQFQRERVRRRSFSWCFCTVSVAVLSFCRSEYFIFLFTGSRARGSSRTRENGGVQETDYWTRKTEDAQRTRVKTPRILAQGGCFF